MGWLKSLFQNTTILGAIQEHEEDKKNQKAQEAEAEATATAAAEEAEEEAATVAELETERRRRLLQRAALVQGGSLTTGQSKLQV